MQQVTTENSYNEHYNEHMQHMARPRLLLSTHGRNNNDTDNDKK